MVFKTDPSSQGRPPRPISLHHVPTTDARRQSLYRQQFIPHTKQQRPVPRPLIVRSINIQYFGVPDRRILFIHYAHSTYFPLFHSCTRVRVHCAPHTYRPFLIFRRRAFSFRRFRRSSDNQIVQSSHQPSDTVSVHVCFCFWRL